MGRRSQLNSGFYGFAYYQSLANREKLHWLGGLYKGGWGPEQPERKSDMADRFDVCTLCLAPFLATRMKPYEREGYATVEKTAADPLAGCTPDERSYCVRLVRLLRYNYWVTTLVTAILDKEAQNKHHISMKWMKQLLDDIENIENKPITLSGAGIIRATIRFFARNPQRVGRRGNRQL